MADKVEIDLVPQVTSSTLAKIKEKLGSAMQVTVGAAKSAGAGIGAAAGALATGPMAAFNALGMLTDLLGKFVESVNPAVMEQLNKVFEDMSGVVGQAVMPIMQLIIPIMRTFADALATVIPSQEKVAGLMQNFQPVLEGLRTAFDKVMPAFGLVIEEMLDKITPLLPVLAELVNVYLEQWSEVMLSLTPIVAELADMFLNLFIPAMTAVAKAIASVVKYVMEQVNKLLQWIGKNGFDITDYRMAEIRKGNTGGRGMKSSMNASKTSAEFVGIEDLGKQLQLAAFGAAISPAQETANTAKEIKKQIDFLTARITNQPVPAFPGN